MLIGKRAVEQGIKSVVFDRSGYKYHGNIKSLADGAREADWNFNVAEFVNGGVLKKINPEELTLKDKVVHINRVAKVVKGGRRFSFSALVVIGDENGCVGYGKGKASEVPENTRKAMSMPRRIL